MPAAVSLRAGQLLLPASLRAHALDTPGVGLLVKEQRDGSADGLQGGLEGGNGLFRQGVDPDGLERIGAAVMPAGGIDVALHGARNVAP